MKISTTMLITLCLLYLAGGFAWGIIVHPIIFSGSTSLENKCDEAARQEVLKAKAELEDERKLTKYLTNQLIDKEL